MTLFPVDPVPAAPWLIVIQVTAPTGMLYAMPLLAHSIRQAEEIATSHIDRLNTGWQPYGAVLASSPVRVNPASRRPSIPYRA